MVLPMDDFGEKGLNGGTIVVAYWSVCLCICVFMHVHTYICILRWGSGLLWAMLGIIEPALKALCGPPALQLSS